MEINILQIIFQMINFGVVFGALTYFLYKPVLKILDDRRQKTEEASKAAEETIREKEEIELLKKKSKTQSEKDAAKVIDTAKEETKELKAKLSKEVKEEVTALRVKELVKIDSEVKSRRAKVEDDVTKIAIAIAEKVIGADVSPKTHKTLISQSIKDLEKAIV